MMTGFFITDLIIYTGLFILSYFLSVKLERYFQ